jgi:hypothetical protein
MKNPVHHKRTKHIDIQHHYVREMVATNEVAFEYCPTLDMAADALSKPVPGLKHSKCTKLLSLKKLNQASRVT